MTALHPFRVADASATSKLDPITLEAEKPVARMKPQETP